MEAARQKTATSSAKTQPAAASKVQRKAAPAARHLSVQLSSKVSSPHDPAEKEADTTARKIMRMAVPESSVAYVRNGTGGVFRQINKEEKEKQPQAGLQSPHISRFADPVPFARKGREEERIQRKATSEPGAGTGVLADIENGKSGGSPLPLVVRRFMEPRFRADFSRVKVHTGDRAAKLNRQLNAQAFATANHIFFAKDRFNPDSFEGKELIAHELTHTVQQGQAVQRTPEISITAVQPHIQRSATGKILDWFADKANLIPGFRMFTVILGMNPINMGSVDRSAANILRALIEFMPGGAIITQVLDNHGVFAKIATWIEGKIKALGMVGQMFKDALSTFVDSLSVGDLAPWNWGDVWNRAKGIFTAPIDRLISFAKGVVTDILKFVREAILKPLAALAQGTRGYDLLRALLGEDPVTGEPVPRNADTLIGGFMKLIGEEEVWENIKKGKAVARTWAWFQTALAGLMGMARAIPVRIVATIRSLTFKDIITVAGAFGKIVGLLAGIVGDFFSWGVKTVWNLLEIVFDVVKPGAMGYVKKAGAAFKSILKNPLPFVKNLAAAAKLGFEFFKDNIWTHLKNGLIEWLTGALNGVYIPKALSLTELGKFALSVLGITWAKIRAKIVKALGDKGEMIVSGIEKGVEWAVKGFEIVKKLATGGIEAAWEMVKEKLNDLKDTVVSGIIGIVVESIVKKAVPKLVSMFIPGAGFISAIISIYDIVMVIVQKIAKIVAVVTGFVNSIMEIVAGNIHGAAIKVNNALAGMLSFAISLFAGFVGLGKVTDKVNDVVMKVRDKVDKAFDAGINWIVTKAKALFAKLFSKKDKPDERTDEQKKRDKLAAIAEAEKLFTPENFDEKEVRGKLGPIKKRYKLLTLNLVVDSQKDDTETVHFTASASEEVIGKPKQVKLVDKPVVELAKNAWIKIMAGNSYEQVTVSGTVARRTPHGLVPQDFMAQVPGGGTTRHLYADENKKWVRTTFTHGSKLVLLVGGGKFKLQTQYRGQDCIRNNFYLDKTSIRDSMKNFKLPSLTAPGGTYFYSQGDPKREASFGYKIDPVKKSALVPISDASADHEPSIAAHWQHKGGNNTNQGSRTSWNASPGTYQIISGKLNSSLSGKGGSYVDDVGINFKGPGE